MRIELLDIQRCQGFPAFRACRDRQLMLGQMRQLTVQPVMAPRPEPQGRVLAVAVLRAQIQFDRQFQMMHAVAVADQHVQFTQGMPGAADRQVGGQ